jgi:hypothetical protein
MRALWKIGWMPNYNRHITAQFLMEYLDLSWKEGFKWFDYTLIDTDVAINSHMWQNGGQSGLDPWNFVMHPIYAAKKCDPLGDYVRVWVPELRNLPKEYIHCPWEAPVKYFLSGGGLTENNISQPGQARGRDVGALGLTNADAGDSKPAVDDAGKNEAPEKDGAKKKAEGSKRSRWAKKSTKDAQSAGPVSATGNGIPELAGFKSHII